MKKCAGHIVGVWMLNAFLLFMYLANRPLYQEFLDSGAQMFTCVDWDAQGHVVPGVCVDLPPSFPGQ